MLSTMVKPLFFSKYDFSVLSKPILSKSKLLKDKDLPSSHFVFRTVWLPTKNSARMLGAGASK